MAIDWTKTGNDVEQAVKAALGNDWNTVSKPVSTQIQALLAVAKSIEDEKDTITKVEYDALCLSQKEALEGVLSTYQAISEVVLEQAVAAAWNVVAQALKTAYNLPFIP